jgi:hypothetical protein
MVSSLAAHSLRIPKAEFPDISEPKKNSGGSFLVGAKVPETNANLAANQDLHVILDTLCKLHRNALIQTHIATFQPILFLLRRLISHGR